MECAGWVLPDADAEVVIRDDLGGREFIAFWTIDGRVAADMNVNVWDVTDTVQDLIRGGLAGYAGRPGPAGRPGRPARGPEVTGDELARLRRCEDSGATWRVIVRTPEGVEIALLTCDAGEEMDRLRSADPTCSTTGTRLSGPTASSAGCGASSPARPGIAAKTRAGRSSPIVPHELGPSSNAPPPP
ncbi:hypothetical protein [Actinoplanes derwentensis]|uniref:hypothetical protein n=1 Tax=Actinoplanes derwentensis TaxID=113562 RepID=UPI001A5D4F26|nr:hypothetical protein [Actinoplanes derwentensis]GID87535.1 hypothetical protein Ade03nite_64590 [Actinoplanes derwentensis]